MKEQEIQSQLVANFSETISIVNLFLSQFEKVLGNEAIKNILPTVEGVYMYGIVMHLENRKQCRAPLTNNRQYKSVIFC